MCSLPEAAQIGSTPTAHTTQLHTDPTHRNAPDDANRTAAGRTAVRTAESMVVRFMADGRRQDDLFELALKHNL